MHTHGGQIYIQLKYSNTIIIIIIIENKYITLNAVWKKAVINSEPLFNHTGQDEGLMRAF